VRLTLTLGKYDYETVHKLIAAAPIVHVSFTPSADEPFPTILPMIGFIGNYSAPDTPLSSGGQDLYVHGHVAARLLKLPAKGEPGVVTEEGLPVCVCASHVDGVVLSLTPFHNSMNYRSAVVHGYATAVEDEAERYWAMLRLTDDVVPERWANSREPSSAELKSTGILKVRIVSASAKVRTGGPNEDRKDEKDESIRGKYWTGVVPARLAFDAPVAAPTNQVAVPKYLSEWVDKYNKEAKEYAASAVNPDGK
jgi:nitroimidazol reductase NimA-like FMN-containing flavoprotein (pyridoxamine 5'-phosphate oxidase superfamily)